MTQERSSKCQRPLRRPVPLFRATLPNTRPARNSNLEGFRTKELVQDQGAADQPTRLAMHDEHLTVCLKSATGSSK
jgi:hypothetical protein